MPIFAAPYPLPTAHPAPSRRFSNGILRAARGVKNISSSTDRKPLCYDDYPPNRTALVVDRESPFRKPRIAEIPVPAPKSGEILIEVHAAGVNTIDWFNTNLLATVPPFLRQSPFVPGKDVSGVVVAVGPGVTEWHQGDEVFGTTGKKLTTGLDGMKPEELASGSFAAFVILNVKCCARKPWNVSFIDAAGIPLAGLTAWQALVETAQLKEGSKVLILGGAGGVGTLAVQIANIHCKCDAVAVTCSKSSSALVKALGADLVIDYHTQFFEQAVGAERYDCVVDAVGYDDKCRRVSSILRRSGILVDVTGPPSLSHLRKGQKTDSMFKHFQGVSGDGKRVRYTKIDAKPDGKVLRKLASYMEKGQLIPVTDKVYDGLGSVQEAFDFSKSGRAHGKLIIDLKEKREEKPSSEPTQGAEYSWTS
ncbi:hypothetical protein BSKO_09776 [Bryopsis sp. KO-2023]|nr:hypothetical protein BSKO_09776 [Bryopsis sp. KO-2023]